MEEGNGKSSTKIHFFYVTLILVLTIVGLITHRWTDIPGFREYLTVGATVTSLVLGVLAIIYSFVATGQQSSVLGAVQAAATSTGGAVGKLDGFMTSARELQAEAAKRTADLHVLTQALAASVNEIRDETKALVMASGEVAGKVNLLPSQLGEIKSIIEQSGKSVPKPAISTPPATEQWGAASIRAALSTSSWYGLVVIEACVRGAELHKDVSIPKLSEGLDKADIGYLWGYLVAFSQTLLIRLATRQGLLNQFEIAWIHPALEESMKQEWDRRIAAAPLENKALLERSRAAALAGLSDPPAPAPTPASPHQRQG